MSKYINIWIDGACGPKNPTGHMGVGVYVETPTTKYDISRFIEEHPDNTNNVAEYLGAIEAFKLILEKQEEFSKHPIFIFSDSLMLVNQLSGKWKNLRTTVCVKKKILQPVGKYIPYALEAKNLLIQVKTFAPNISIEWIPREENAVADHLSKKGFVDRMIYIPS